MISKGKYEKGAVWVAQRIPDGHVSGTANQARIRNIDFNDAANFIYAHDVVSFARKKLGYNGTDADFSFSDFYDPVSVVSARVSEARVWSLFNHLNASGHAEFDAARYHKYIRGEDLADRMPFSVPITRKLSLDDVRGAFRQHMEGTVFDNTKDVGAGPFASPYRWRPLVWSERWVWG